MSGKEKDDVEEVVVVEEKEEIIEEEKWIKVNCKEKKGRNVKWYWKGSRSGRSRRRNGLWRRLIK